MMLYFPMLALLAPTATAYVVLPPSGRTAVLSQTTLMAAAADQPNDNEEETEESNNNGGEFNLEFIDYDDPNYVVDQASALMEGDTEASSLTTEQELEAMREERRVRNDEYQFQSYYTKIQQKGAVYAGDWTVYRVHLVESDSDDPNAPLVPTLQKGTEPFLVTSTVKLVDDKGDDQRLAHTDELHAEHLRGPWEDFYQPYSPTPDMGTFDFRGTQGNMVCGDNAWTICQAINAAGESAVTGPFAAYRAELGLQYQNCWRYRIKLDYRQAANDDGDGTTAPLQLKYLAVCREVLVNETATPTDDDSTSPSITFPRDQLNYALQQALFGPAGADGGLYDPPPIPEDRQDQYVLLDLPGHATALLPATMDQTAEPDWGGGSTYAQGWVTSLDWTPGAMRYQVDRKVRGGTDLLGLRSLELSEVEAAAADQYRPRDGGQDMRQ